MNQLVFLLWGQHWGGHCQLWDPVLLGSKFKGPQWVLRWGWMLERRWGFPLEDQLDCLLGCLWVLQLVRQWEILWVHR